MNSHHQRGYADQRAGTLAAEMMTGAGPDALEYRNGARQARRDQVDEEEGRAAPAAVVAQPQPPTPAPAPINPAPHLGAWDEPDHKAKKPRKKRKPDGDEEQTAFL